MYAPVKSKVSVKMNLNKGTVDGVVQTTGESIGTLSPARYDDEKAMAIVQAFAPILDKDIENTQKSEVFDISASE